MPMTSIQTVVNNNLKLLAPQISNYRILLMISGGLDSVVLFDILNKNKHYKIHLFHCNYNSQINSNIAELFCRKLAEKNDCNINIKNIKISSDNFESNARKIRYDEAYNIAEKHSIDIILTAHHQDDQLETLYIKKRNGSDWVSNVGIRDVYNKIRRPMLSISREDILIYANCNVLNWVEDNSNNNLKIYRNYIRKKNKPDYIQKILSDSLSSKIKYDNLKNRFMENPKEYILDNDSNYLNVKNCVAMIDNLFEFKLYYQFMMSFFLKIDINNSKSYWASLYCFIKNSNSGSRFILNKNYSILNNRNNHFVYKNGYLDSYIKNETKIRLDMSLDKISWLDHSFYFNDRSDRKKSYSISILPYEIIQEGVYIRSWKKGDVCYSVFYKKYIKVSKIFINYKISIFDKIKYPIFVDSNDEIITIPKLYNRFQNKDISKKIEVIWS